jgi:hypothetical protein
MPAAAPTTPSQHITDIGDCDRDRFRAAGQKVVGQPKGMIHGGDVLVRDQ